jgi:serine/threonine protein kinase
MDCVRGGSELERELDLEAEKPRRNDGSFNTVIPTGEPRSIWRVTKGTDEHDRRKRLLNHLLEARVASLAGHASVGPAVLDSFASNSWLSECRQRVAMKYERYTSDLHDALFGDLPDSRGFGAAAGELLCTRLQQLGCLSVFHADLKPENVLIRRHGPELLDLRITDFDPNLLFVGHECAATPRELFAVMNLGAFWLFMQDRAGTLAAAACAEALAAALTKTHYALAQVEPQLPANLLALREHFCSVYRTRAWSSLWQRFPSLMTPSSKKLQCSAEATRDAGMLSDLARAFPLLLNTCENSRRRARS